MHRKNLKNKSKKIKKISSNTIIFILFECIFTIITFPFLLLYGPFEDAKSIYVGSAMTTMSHQYLAKWFLSDEKIESILKKSSTEISNENTDIDKVKILNKNDDTI